MEENYEKNLKVWKSLSKDLISISYLRYNHTTNGQKNFSKEEKDIFNEIESKKIKTYEVLKNFNQDDYNKIDLFSNICKNNISYLDLNKNVERL